MHVIIDYQKMFKQNITHKHFNTKFSQITVPPHTHTHTGTRTYTHIQWYPDTYRDPLDCNMTFRQLKRGQNKEMEGDSLILYQSQRCEHNLGIKRLLTNEGVHHKNGKHDSGYRHQEVGLIDSTDNDTLCYYPHFSSTGDRVQVISNLTTGTKQQGLHAHIIVKGRFLHSSNSSFTWPKPSLL